MDYRTSEIEKEKLTPAIFFFFYGFRGRRKETMCSLRTMLVFHIKETQTEGQEIHQACSPPLVTDRTTGD